MSGGDDPSEAKGSFEARLRAAKGRTTPPVPAQTGAASPMGIGVRVGVELVSALVWRLPWDLRWIGG